MEDEGHHLFARNNHVLAFAILRRTHNSQTSLREVTEESGHSEEDASAFLKELVKLNYVSLAKDGKIGASSRQRLRISFEIMKSGSDPERVCKYLGWQEFEEASAQILEETGYRVFRRFRFKGSGRRWEIDLIGVKRPLILCFDCKHWKGGGQRSAMAKAAEAQAKRVEALAKLAREKDDTLGLRGWSRASFLPAMISLLDVPLRIHEGVPTVPIFQLDNFLYELPAAQDSLRFVEVPSLNQTKKWFDSPLS
jgi:Holliday junction resolvase-like predicted endonuclease